MKTAIDIGTNTVLLLVATVEEGCLNIIEEQQRVPRLGRGVDHDNKITDTAASRVIEVLLEYREILDTKFPDAESPVITATSAVRDAANRKDFITRCAHKTGFNIKVLSGNEEAEYTYQGAQSVLPANKAGRSQTVLDIGGGSTEIADGRGEQLAESHSFDMGCVRYTERFLGADIPTNGEIKACRRAVRDQLEAGAISISDRTQLIGVAGTITSLAMAKLELTEYDPALINGYTLSLSGIRSLMRSFSRLLPKEIESQYPEALGGRAEIILAGLLILEEVMSYYNQRKLTVSTGGIRHGAILEDNRMQ